MENEIELRRLTIKSYHVDSVVFGDKFSLKKDGTYWKMTIKENLENELIKNEEMIENMIIKIINPNDDHHIMVNTIMDVIPISVKALGIIGEGITHTITGCYIVLTGVDSEGRQVCAFGNSDGYLDEHMIFDRPGTPSKNDIIILIDMKLVAKAGLSRNGVNSCHRVVDNFCDFIRPILKKANADDFTEKHIYKDVIRPNKKKVAIVKLVSGQGAMYDTVFLAKDPSGFLEGRSIIDIEGAPMVLSPNEYRDGALRALYG